ncbi:Mbeg1-like protein [Ruminococcus sp.]|uniref:Mbeg1-like protein n=1 Tax=Ruminococcus sp. TaxID=41978 RepID=UPI0025D64AA1|nr:Mbeg1-like protein [Ruminococcus sp.]MCR4640243.1 DUF2974 domain-containing protein [Ruminococcus sp.]
MSDFFAEKGITNEARASIILNTFMYVDRCIKSEKSISLKSIIEQISFDGLEDSQKAALEIVKRSLALKRNADVGALELVSFSEHDRKRYKGACGAVFRSSDGTAVYVVYRGTGTGRWYDNGDGLSNTSSEYQNVALRYFNDVLDTLDLGDNVKLVVTGHSKGGNLSQFVTLKSGYGGKVRYCISFDGQGFSPEFLKSIDYYIEKNSRVRSLCEKMYSVCGDNDYVNVLGNKVIPKPNTVYIRTNTASADIFGAHTIVPEYYKDVDAHYCDYLFDFRTNMFNEQVSRQRELARCSQELSRNAMNLPHDKREDICRTLMTLSEQFIGGSNSPNGLGGEKATLEESVGFLTNLYEIIVPLTSYVGTRQGEDMLFDLLILPNDVNADSSLASAPISDRLNYVMSDPDLMKLYYLGASLAIESISERAAQVGYAVGEVTSKQLTAELGLILQNQLSAMDMVSSCLKGTASIVSNAVAAVKSCIKDSMRVREGFLRSIGLGSLAGFNNWSRYFEYRNNEGKLLRYGTSGDDSLMYTDEAEAIYGGRGNDTLHGHGGDDDIYGEEGNDRLFGWGGSDKLFGGEGMDTLRGDQDNDYLHGGFGDDTLKGGAGNDALYGSVGNDKLHGDEGNDILCGGVGDDEYYFKRGFGSDTINDTDGDEKLIFEGMQPSEMVFTASGDNSVIIRNINTGDRVTIRNFKPERYTFVFSGAEYAAENKSGAYMFRRI